LAFWRLNLFAWIGRLTLIAKDRNGDLGGILFADTPVGWVAPEGLLVREKPLSAAQRE